MKRALGPILAIFFFACTGDRPLIPSADRPVAQISDGNHSLGNPDFFFLPPLVPLPSGNVNYQPALFNPALVPVVDVCELSGDPMGGAVSCVRTVFGPVNATLNTNHYVVNWATNLSNAGAGLNVANFYRIRVFGSLGGKLLGFADVDPVSTGKELKNIQTNEIIGLVDGRTLPIKFEIEEGALCDPPGTSSCTTQTIPLTTGGTVVLEETGDRVIVPPQPNRPGQVISLSLQPCPSLPIDNPKVGPCLRVIADPPLVGPLVVRARVLLCSLNRNTDLTGLSHEQTHLLKVHRLDVGPPVVVQALPETPAPECLGGLGSVQPKSALDWLGQLAAAVFGPRELRASSAVLDVGEGGSTDFFSSFQLALPIKMQVVGLIDFIGDPNLALATPPRILVTDYHGEPAAGARIHFQITSVGGGSVTPLEVTSSADPVANVTVGSWVLGAAGVVHTLRAYGWGIASPADNGPQDGFDPYQPDITLPLSAQSPVPVHTGQLLFTGTARNLVEGLWTATGSLTAGKRDAAAALLNNGDVLVVGGVDDFGAQVYHPATGVFLATEGRPQFNHRSGLTATKLADGRVLVIGGMSAANNAEIYDPSTGAFTAVGGTLFSRIFHTATLLPNGKVLVVAGDVDTPDGFLTHATAEVFDPATNAFTLTGTLNVDRAAQGAVLLGNGQVLVVGGQQSTSPGFAAALRSAELWDPESGAWTLLAAQLSTNRAGPLVAMLGTGKVLVAGGAFSATSAELFDPAALTFTATGSTSSVHGSGDIAILADGRVLVMGGVQTGGGDAVTLNTAEIYNPATGLWTLAAPMLAARQQFTATTLLDGRVLVVGGASIALPAFLSSAETYSTVPPIP